MKVPTMTIRIEPDLRLAIKALAEATERSEAGVIKVALDRVTTAVATTMEEGREQLPRSRPPPRSASP